MRLYAVQDRNRIALEGLESVLSELKGETENDIRAEEFIVIVEGRRDVSSLRKLGVNTEIVPCANQPMAAFCEKIAETKKTAIILTDWDRKGGILAARLEEQFKNLGVPFETAPREKLIFLTKKEIKDVESLASLVEKLRKTVHCGRQFGKNEEEDPTFEPDAGY